jgi:hypothetical protein
LANPISWSCGSERAPELAPPNIRIRYGLAGFVTVTFWRDLLADMLKRRRHVGDRCLIQIEKHC